MEIKSSGKALGVLKVEIRKNRKDNDFVSFPPKLFSFPLSSSKSC